MTLRELIDLTGATDLTPDTDKNAEISCGGTRARRLRCARAGPRAAKA